MIVGCVMALRQVTFPPVARAYEMPPGEIKPANAQTRYAAERRKNLRIEFPHTLYGASAWGQAWPGAAATLPAIPRWGP